MSRLYVKCLDTERELEDEYVFSESLEDLELLPNILQRKYALLRDLDKSLQGILHQNVQCCEQELENFKQGMLSGSMSPEPSRIKLSDEALDEQKHSIRIVNKKLH